MMASSPVSIISDMMKAPGNVASIQSKVDQEKIDMNYIFEIEDSLTRRRPIYVRKIGGHTNFQGNFYPN